MRAFLSKLSAAALGILGLTTVAVESSAQTTVLVGWTNSWAYNDTTTPAANLHGTGWQLPGYDTNSAPGWKTAPALFGNDSAGLYNAVGRPFSGGINGFLTPLNRSVVGASDRVTFYFRKKFTFNGSANAILETKWVHDDGIVVYINGTEVLRSKMQVPAPDPVNWDSLGANHDAAAFPPLVPEAFEYSLDLDSSLLVQGENTVAVELHQSSTTSSDVSFAMQLSSIIPFAPVLLEPNQPTNRTLLQFRSSVLSAAANARPAPTYQWYLDGSPIDGASASTLLITNDSPATVTHQYFCRVSNAEGSVDTREASVLFTADNTPPSIVAVSQAGAFNTVAVTFDEALDLTTATEPFTYILNDGNSPTLVTLNPDGASVTVTYQNDMLPGTAYTITIGGVADVAGNAMPQEANIQFISWVPAECGGVLFQTFDTASAPGTPINLLTGHPNFPNNPRETFRMPSFSTRNSYTDDSHEQFGGRLRALFIPPTSGNWVFYLSSDDAGVLYFNPNGPGEGGKVKIQEETGCCNPYSAHASAPYALEAGKAYYIEALYKEATGGDYLHVWAGPQGVPPPSAAAASLTPGDAIPGAMLGSVAAPINAAGPITITQQPANLTVVPNATATFSVTTSGDALKCYQWLRDGAEIPNANGTSHTFTAGPGDNGAKFTVRISILGGDPVTSAEATLTVAADTVRPTVVSVASDAAGTSVTITFSEPMGASVANAASYTVNGSNPSTATQTSPTVVILALASPLQDCVHNALVITGVVDASANPINPNPATVNFTKPQILVGNTASQIWTFEDTGADLTGTGWRDLNFNDSGWASGAGPLGLEDAAQMPAGWEIRTPTPNYTGARITMYFRTKFNLATDPRTITNLRLTQVLDDGAVYWINGKELGRLRCAANPAYATLADGSTEPHPIEVAQNLPVADLVYGENVLAVEVHQSGTASTDIVFGAELVATISACAPPLTVTRSGNNVVLTWPDAAFSLQKAPTVTGPWTTQAGASGVSLPASPDNAFFRLVKP